MSALILVKGYNWGLLGWFRIFCEELDNREGNLRTKGIWARIEKEIKYFRT